MSESVSEIHDFFSTRKNLPEVDGKETGSEKQYFCGVRALME